MTNDEFSYFLITKIASICTISKENVLQVKHTNLLNDVLDNQRKILLLNTNHSCVFVLTRSSLAKFSQCNSSQLYSRIKSNYTSLLIRGTLERDSKTSRRNSQTHFASFFNECRRFTASTVRVPCKSLRCFKSVLWTRLL